MTTSPLDGRVTPAGHGLVPAPRRGGERLPDQAAVATAWTPLRLCRCGHEQDAHEHFRPGDDCGVCGAGHCRTFRMRVGRRARSSGRRR